MRIEDFLKKWANKDRLGFSDLHITTAGGGPPDNSDNWQKLKIACSIQFDGLPWIEHVTPTKSTKDKSQDALIDELLDDLDRRLTNSKPNAEEVSNRLSNRPQKPILAVVLGAGFSAGFSWKDNSGKEHKMPVTKELPDKLREPHPEYLHWSSPGSGFYNEALAFSILPKLGSEIRDLEAFLSIWEGVIDQQDQAPGGIESEVYRCFLWNMAHWFAQWSREAEESTEFKKLQEWLVTARQSYDVRFITFNYDLIVERLCKSCGLPFKYLDSSRDGSFVSIHKLHGSVNFYRGRNGTNPIYNLGEDSDFVYEVCDLNRLPSETWQKPVLIPPSANKEYKHFFDCTWAFAMKDLRDAEKILFVGYSFPGLDVFSHKKFNELLFGRQSNIFYVLPDGNGGNDRMRVEKALGQPPIWIGKYWKPEDFWTVLRA